MDKYDIQTDDEKNLAQLELERELEKSDWDKKVDQEEKRLNELNYD